MKSFVSKVEVRELNKKLFAFDMRFNNEDDVESLDNVIINILQQYNAEDKLGGIPSIIELTQSNFNDEILKKIQLLPPKSILIQINNKLIESEKQVALIKIIKEYGYKVVIEINKEDKHFNYAKIIADIIKIDARAISQLNAEFSSFICKKLAYNINTAEDFILAESVNIDYYEGSYIATSVDMDIRQIGHSKLNFAEILQEVRHEKDKYKIADLISRDPLLSAQIIRLCTSLSNRVSNIREAVEKIKPETMERWIYLLQFQGSNNISEDIIRESYNRAEMCRLIAKETHREDITEDQAYFIGLFSELDILSGRSMSSEIYGLNLDEVVEKALIYRTGTGAAILNLVIAYENADWNVVRYICWGLGFSQKKLFKCYFDSVNAIAKIWDDLESMSGGARFDKSNNV